MGAAHCPIMPYASYLSLARECLGRFPRSPRPRVSQSDSAHLRTVEGIIAVHDEEYDQAISHFEHVLRLEDEIENPDLIAFAQGAIARAYTKKGAYTKAEEFVGKAITTALSSGRKEMVAGLAVRKGWISFQQNRSKDAANIFAQAEMELQGTDDYLTLGNLKAATGRLARRDGEYYDALKAYAHALRHYKRCDSRAQHPNLARALTNIALLRRLIALRISHVQKTKPDIDEDTYPSIQRLRKKAVRCLGQASAIFEREQDYRGRGSVLLIAAGLHTDEGDLDTAASESALAYELGRKKRDYILMARARVQQGVVQNAKAESCKEKTSAYAHAERGLSFTEEGNELAEQNTQNMRLTAYACIWRGIMLMNIHLLDTHEAYRCYSKARELLMPPEASVYFVKPIGRDYVWDDLQMLGKRLTHAGCDIWRSEDFRTSEFKALNETARR